LFSGSYLSFETDARPERLLEVWPEATLARLREIKGEWDPENVFRDNFNVTAAPPANITRLPSIGRG
jgi:hypothetical protein